MDEEPNIVYGRLLEAVHICSYTAARAAEELKWLVTENRWMKVGNGFTELQAKEFLDSINVAEFNYTIEQRKELAQMLRDMLHVSQRAIAKALGVHHSTIQEDLRGGNPPKDDERPIENQEVQKSSGGNPPSVIQQSGSDAADELRRKAEFQEKREERVEQKELEIRASEELGKYHVLIIDPPWPVQKLEYPTLTVQEISEYEYEGRKIKDLAADHAHIFLWTTHKFLPDAFRLLKNWSFRYICTLVWKKSGGFQPVGLPQYNCEFVLYAQYGNPEFVETKDFFCCFEGSRREHSRKPELFYDMIQRVTSESRLDVFSREKHDGFAQLGNQINEFALNESE